MNTFKTSVIVLLITLVSGPAYAYLDPGAGSMIIQMLIAGIVGALFTIKMYWYRLKAIVLRWMGKEVPDYHFDDADDQDEESTEEKKDQ